MVDEESDRDESLRIERVFEPSRIAREALACAYEAAAPAGGTGLMKSREWGWTLAERAPVSRLRNGFVGIGVGQ